MSRILKIQPAGMTYERALQIAIDSLNAADPLVRVSSDNSNGFRLTEQLREQIIRLSKTMSINDVALETEVSSRTVSRVINGDRAEREWTRERRRQLNLESFRRMTEEWTEIPA